MSVNFLGIEQLDADFLPIVPFPLVEEAGTLARMAGGAPNLVYFYQNGVFIAIGVKSLYFLHISRFFALFPELFTAPAPVGHIAGLGGVLQRVPVGEREHQDFARLGVLRDNGNEAVFLEFQAIDPAHELPPKNEK